MKNRKIQEMLADAEHAILYATSLLRTVKEELKNSEAPIHAEETAPTPASAPPVPPPPKKEVPLSCDDPKGLFYDPDAYLTHQFMQRKNAEGGCFGDESDLFIGKDYAPVSDETE